MSNVKELTHALTIVQTKLNACLAQKADLLNKVKLIIIIKKNQKRNIFIYPPHSQMSTKRRLLHESRQTLQNQYAYSLTQENKPSRIIPNNNNNNKLDMVPIIGGSTNNQTTISEPSTNKFNLYKLRLNCILQHQVQLSCFPVMYIPETVNLNKYANVQPDQIIHLYYTFDLLPDILYDQLKLDLKVYCLANQVWEISWKLDDDITWTSTFFF
ncbi:hypothetical protein BDF21DRAFT_433247 [Thamnidium elegans]|nr:hypothetical protein BDF21DRAFT_433247 [Thamnidium elegans]